MNIQTALEQAFNYHQQGNLQKAQALYQAIIKIQPKHFDALHLLGVLARQQGDSERAVDLISQALAINPKHAGAYNNQGNALSDLGQWQEAVASYQQAIRFKPDYVQAYYHLGYGLFNLGQYQAAVECYDQALTIQTIYPQAYNDKANALCQLKNYSAALIAYQNAIKQKPDYADAYYNLGNLFFELNHYQQALQSYDKALALQADYPQAFNNRGNVLVKLSQFQLALASFQQAIALNPLDADSVFNLANALQCLKRDAEAIKYYDQAIQLRPDAGLIFGYKAQSALALCDWDLVAQQSQLIQAGIAQKQAVVDPLTLLFLTDDPEQQLAAAKIWTQTRHSQHPMLPAISQRNRQQKIRIAYYSADFHDHATAYLIAELFELHDKSKFELIGFSFGPDKQDDMRNRLVAAFDQFIDVRQRSDLAVAELSRELAIDIAIDLKGYTQNSRAGIFALRAAPIQVSYLGYPGTMGADFIDYLLADKVLIPESHQTYYAEKIVYLPNSYQVNDGKRQIAERQLTRQEMGLPEDGVVFCCFTNSNKISRDSFVNWLTILASVEGSVLWLIEDNPLASEHLRQLALEHKIDPVRLVFAQRLPLAEHLARHRLADLFLDTLPYNAHTRASDALWAGLPVLTCIGESFAGRVAASLLMAIGLPELITLNQAEYQQLAITLANDRQRLKSIRERLAVNRLSSPLFDSALFVRHIEVAYQLIYQRWLAGLLPAHLQVESHGH